MKRRTLWKNCLLVGIALALAAPAVAEDKKKVIETKATKLEAAASVNFGEALGLDLGSLSSLGARIDAARTANDPVALALAAKELAVAEEISGKSASLKSADVAKEAVALAKARNRPSELKAVAALVAEAKADLLAQASKTEAAIKARADGEQARGIEGTLYIRNNTRWYIDIYINGNRVGTSYPYHNGSIYVGESPIFATTLYGSAPGTSITWGPILVDYRLNDYTWTLNP
ncbi:MAG: hypothetical protein SFU86_11060 [Pirellulaceae bacterium]|nr:hypothetical protein [Pirellulaceae bacterium]